MLQKKSVALESLCQWDIEEASDPISIMGIWQPNDALQNLAENDWPSSILSQYKGEKTGCGTLLLFLCCFKSNWILKTRLAIHALFLHSLCLLPLPSHTYYWLHFHDSMVVLVTILLFLVHRNQPLFWGYFCDEAVTSGVFSHFSSLQIKVVAFKMVIC